MEGAYSARSERATAWLIGAWGFPQPRLTALTQETFLITRLKSEEVTESRLKRGLQQRGRRGAEGGTLWREHQAHCQEPSRQALSSQLPLRVILASQMRMLAQREGLSNFCPALAGGRLGTRTGLFPPEPGL